jgi:hypothetical protein
MKRIFSLFLMISALIAFSCSDNATAPTTGGIGGGIGGGGTTGGVTYTVTLAQDNQQQYYFEFKPSVDAVITTITANCAAANVNNEQVTDDGTTVYNANNPAYVGPITVLAQGQQWTFTIAGKLGSSTGTAYSVTANFTVQ